MTTTFLRLLAHDDKPAALAEAVAALREGRDHADAFRAEPASFAQVPGSPFAYWVGETLRCLFTHLSPLKYADRDLRSGGSTKNDLRFLRLWWEVQSSTSARDRSVTYANGRWVPFEKGGSYSPYYRDWELTIDWKDDGRILKAEISEYRGSRGWGYDWSADIKGHGHYFRPGISWPRRTQAGLHLRVMQAGCIFADKGPAVFVDSDSPAKLAVLLGLMNSRMFATLVELQMAFGSYEVGVVKQTPVPLLDDPAGERLGALALACVELKRDLDRANETSHVFHLPALLQVPGATFAERAAAWAARVAADEAQLAANQREIDAIAFELYGIDPSELGGGSESVVGGPLLVAETDDEAASLDDEDDEDPTTHNQQLTTNNQQPTTYQHLLSYLVGCAFGRWDVRYATGERTAPVLLDPFAPLPACSPGMLTGEDGLPLREASAGYPLRIDADGILVDDADHGDDIVGRVRAALELIFGRGADAVEREICAALGTERLREYLRRPGAGGFWQDHVRRYSKSRRKAPIYWLLQSPRKHYALWIYLHRLDGDTLSKALVSYVEPKLRIEEERLATLRASLTGLAGRELRQAERDAERQEAVIADVRELRDRLDRAVRRYLTPDLNDGVVLTIAPLHELVPWREAKQYWDELLAGKYEWSSIGRQLREKGLVK